MNTSTGEIKPLEDLTPEQRQSGQWVPLDEQQAAILRALPRRDRVRKLKAWFPGMNKHKAENTLARAGVLCWP